MKKNLILLTVLFTTTIVLSACNNGANEDESSEDTSTVDTAASEDKDESDPNAESVDLNGEDQPDLGIGDTGKVQSTLGTYEITLNSAQIKDDINGQPSELDQLVILDITLKNTSEEALDITDILGSFEVTKGLELSGFGDVADYYDGLEVMEGEIASKEIVTGQLVIDALENDVYYFRENPGTVEAGLSNKVIWTFKSSEAK